MKFEPASNCYTITIIRRACENMYVHIWNEMRPCNKQVLHSWSSLRIHVPENPFSSSTFSYEIRITSTTFVSHLFIRSFLGGTCCLVWNAYTVHTNVSDLKMLHWCLTCIPVYWRRTIRWQRAHPVSVIHKITHVDDINNMTQHVTSRYATSFDRRSLKRVLFDTPHCSNVFLCSCQSSVIIVCCRCTHVEHERRLRWNQLLQCSYALFALLSRTE